jgi:hypothetical protein
MQKSENEKVEKINESDCLYKLAANNPFKLEGFIGRFDVAEFSDIIN